MKISLLTALLLFLAVSVASAGKPPVNGKVAIKGYDPVAYFKAGEPVKGDKEITHTWNGAEWRFSSTSNRDEFAKQPEKFAPQYGGYCAWAVSQGYTASIDPDAWRIVDGKLYLNYSKRVQDKWLADVPGHIQSGDANWPAVLDK